MNDSAKIIVTGGLGYIGSHLSVELLKRGWAVLIIDNQSNSPEIAEHNIKSNLNKEELSRLRIFHCDINDENFISEIMDAYSNIVCVFHIAGLKSVNESIEKSDQYYRVNVGGTLTLLQCMKKHAIHRLIFAGSASVYGDCIEGNCRSIIENTVLKPTNPYGRSKVMCEQVIEDFCETNKPFKSIVLRYFNPAGASLKYNLGEDTPTPQNVVPILIEKISTREPFVIFGEDYSTTDGTAVRDYFHIDDLIQAHVNSLDKIKQSNFPKHTVLNIGSGKGTSVKQLIDTFKTINDIDFQTIVTTKREGDVAMLVPNIDKARKLINYNPVNSIENICKSAYDYKFNNG